MPFPWRDKETVQELLEEKGLSMADAARELGCHKTTIIEWANKHGVKSKYAKHSTDSTHPWHDSELLRQMYVERKMNAEEIANELGCGQTTIYKWMKKHGIETRDLAEARAVSGSYNPPPSLTTNSHGYEVFRNQHRGEQDRFYHHRLLAVSKYGFDSVSGMHVHHKNHIRWDNRPENIELVEAADHQSHHLNVQYGNKPMPLE